MGLKDVFRRKSPVEKAKKDLTEPYAQPDVRRAAVTALLDIGTDEAYDALLQRFTFNAHGQIADESEKRDLVDHLVAVGDRAVPSIKRFIETEKNVGFPIRALSQIVSKDACVGFLIETLRAKEPLDHRSTESKRALITAIGDLGSTDAGPALEAYLQDHHDDVQATAIDAIERLDNPACAASLAEVCARKDVHAARIQLRAAQALFHREWPVKAQFDRFVPEVKDEYLLGKKGNLQKKTRPAAKSAS